MNLQKLFKEQAILDADIEKHHPVQDGEDRLSKNILALLVELGECANEWRGFKYWSNDQKPRVYREVIPYYAGIPFFGDAKVTNPLLEEYVDCFSLILNIGNDLYFDDVFLWDELESDETDIIEQFKSVFKEVMDLSKLETIGNFMALFEEFYILGKMLGFTCDQIEQAYFDKNKINHQRQETGY